MEKLEKVIEEMAKKQFKQDSINGNEFLLQKSTLGEFMKYFNEKGWGVSGYQDTPLGNMQGLLSSFLHDVLWVRMKDSYIEKVVDMLEKKLDPTIEVNINIREQLNHF